MKARIAGATLAWDDVGSGAPIVFLHAFPLDRRMWAPQTVHLAARTRCIAVDLRGFGESSATPPWSMDRYADDVAALLDALHIERAVVIGLSMGGYVAFALWRRHHDRVRALVLADTRAGADTPEGRDRRRALIETARAQGSAAVAERQLDALLGTTTRERRPEVRDRVRDIMADEPVAGIIGALEAMMARPDSTSTLATIDVPTLLVVGEEDAVTPPAEARAMQKAIANSQLVVVPEAGHLSNIERPDAFNATLDAFIAESLQEASHGG